ncbi:MAG: TetR/AcrR family transcriptional regulator [Bacteroidales bacterium]
MKTERQQEIIDVALKLINEKGIQGLTMKNLSKEIGISEPAIYRHFENKIEILLAILDLFRESTREIFEKELHSGISATEKIEHLFTRHFERFAGNPSLVSVIFSEELFRGEPVLMEKIADVIDKNATILTRIIRQGQQNGEIRDDISADHLAITVMGSLRLFVKIWQFSGYRFDIREDGQKILNSVKLLIKAA